MLKRNPGQKMIRPLRNETDYNAALTAIERYFDELPNRTRRQPTDLICWRS
jgi:antitoxin component HigA of HigAB toxin-antitoxin module